MLYFYVDFPRNGMILYCDYLKSEDVKVPSMYKARESLLLDN